MRAVGIHAGVYALAFGTFFVAQRKEIMVPAKDTTGIKPPPTAMHCVKASQCFYPMGYAFDVTIPIITSDQAENWRPNTAAYLGLEYLGLDICAWHMALHRIRPGPRGPRRSRLHRAHP